MSTFTNRTSSVPESFLLHMVSCDCPVRNMQHYWPQFHGYYTVCDNKVYCN